MQSKKESIFNNTRINIEKERKKERSKETKKEKRNQQ